MRLDPTFLICSERCGSNLIRAIMDAHSDVYAPPPLQLGRIWYNIYKFGDLNRDENWAAVVRRVVGRFRDSDADLSFDLTEEEVFDNVRMGDFGGILIYLYSKGMKLENKTLLFLKEHRTHRQVPYLLSRFPKAKFVIQVRDPRDFLASCKNISRIGYHYGSAMKAIEIYREDQERTLNLLYALPASQIYIQRYEDLVTQPETVISALCEFLRIDFESNMLSFHDKDAAKRAAAAQPNYWRNLKKPLMSSSVGKYKTILSRIELRAVEDRVGYVMRQLGYPPNTEETGLITKAALGIYFVWQSVRLPLYRRYQKFKTWVRGGGGRVSNNEPRDIDIQFSYARTNCERINEDASDGTSHNTPGNSA